MKLWGGDSDTGCCSVSDVDDARRVAQQLGIDHLVFNFGDDFDEHVVNPYVDAHQRGVTPNPCIECNRSIKFARLAARADLLGFDAVATGHHARIGRTANGRLTIERGRDAAKDQSYVVHMLDQAQLARTLFPVGHLDKSEVRALAAEINLRTADKPDSQDVCFITKSDGRETFLGERIPFRSAQVVDADGGELGTVEAVELITIGQRRGLGLPGGGPKLYVTAVDIGQRVVTVGGDDDLLDEGLRIEQMSWVDDCAMDDAIGGDVLVQCSAHGTPRRATVCLAKELSAVSVTWASPERRVAPGQSIVLYDLADERVLGGGLCT